MTSDEEILIEQYFPYRNISFEDRNTYINLLLNTKDISESSILYSDTTNSKFDLVFVNFVGEKEFVTFDGAISNGFENKYIRGFIAKKNNKFLVHNEVFRCYSLIDEDEKYYTVVDEFVFKEGKTLRRSVYSNGEYNEDEVSLMNEEEITAYLRKKAGINKEDRSRS